MYTMQYDIKIGKYTLGLLDKVEIKKSVELLADTATITLPASQYNIALEVENKLKRGDRVSINLGYKEAKRPWVQEFKGYLQRIGTDGGNIILQCEDDLFLFRKELPNKVVANISLMDVLKTVVNGCGLSIDINCTYTWKYEKFVINDATGYDVLKKIQEESGADIYIMNNTLHVHPPGEPKSEKDKESIIYDFAYNVESENLTYKRAEDKKIKVVVKALLPDGKVKEIECGSTGGEKIEVKCATSDEASMKARGNAEIKRRSFDGYEGSITGWLIPVCNPSDSVTVHDKDYEYKNGTYFVNGVTTTFGKDGAKREINLGFRLS